MKFWTFFSALLLNFGISPAQQNNLLNLLSDIQNSKIYKGNSASEYYGLSTQKDFDSYIFLTNNFKSDTINSIALIKDGAIIGLLTACDSCKNYNLIKITSQNNNYPKLAISLKRNGVINKAILKTSDHRTVTVGDNNNDNVIDYVSYYIGDGLYSVLLLSNKLDSIKGYLIFNSLEQEYIGILTLKAVKQKIIFDKCFIKDHGSWSAFNISGSQPIYLTSKSEKQILKEYYPDLSGTYPDLKLQNRDSATIVKQGATFANMMKSKFYEDKIYWQKDFKTILSSNVIGIHLPKIIVVNLQTK